MRKEFIGVLPHAIALVATIGLSALDTSGLQRPDKDGAGAANDGKTTNACGSPAIPPRLGETDHIRAFGTPASNVLAAACKNPFRVGIPSIDLPNEACQRPTVCPALSGAFGPVHTRGCPAWQCQGSRALLSR